MDKLITLLSVLITGTVSIYTVYSNNQHQIEIAELNQKFEIHKMDVEYQRKEKEENCAKVDELLLEVSKALDSAYNNKDMSAKERAALYKSVAFLGEEDKISDKNDELGVFKSAVTRVAKAYSKCINKNA